MLEKLFTLFKHASVGAICISGYGYCKFANKSFVSLLALDDSNGDLYQKRITEVLPRFSKEKGTFNLNKLLSGELHSCTFDEKIILKNHQSVTVRFNFWTVDLENNRFFFGLAEEIPDEGRDAFLSIIHDMRNPLSAARSLTDILIESVPLTGKPQVLAEKLVQNIERTDQIARNFLDRQKANAGQKKLNIERLELAQCIKEILDNYIVIYSNRFSLQLDSQVFGFWNRDEIHRIVENLISNALKYSYPDTVVRVSLSKLHSEVQFKVQNFGKKLTEDERAQIFNRYFRSVSAEVNQIQGWGLGLTITRSLVEAYNGNITVDSSDQEGTVFTVTLPMSG